MTTQEYLNLKQTYTLIIQEESKNHEAYYQRGNCCTNLNEITEAICDFSVAIDLITIEVIEKELELEEEHELLLEEINNLQDNIILYYLSRATAFIDNNMYKEALEDLNYVIEKTIKIINDENINNNTNIANNEDSEDDKDDKDNKFDKYDKYDKYDEDIEIYEAYIQQIIIYYSVRGVVYNKLNQFDKAIADFNSSINLSDKILMYKDQQVASFYKERALTYLHTKEFDLALEDLNLAISLDAQQDVYYYMRAMTTVFKNDVANNTQAIKDLDLAIKLNPKKIIYYTIKADLLIKLDKKEEAVNSIPENLYYFRAIYYKKIFQWDNCVEEILKGLNANAVIPENFKALKDILLNIDFNKYNKVDLEKDLIKLFILCDELKSEQVFTGKQNPEYVSYYTSTKDVNYLFSSKDNLKFKLKNNTNNNFGDFMVLLNKAVAKNNITLSKLILDMFSEDNLNIKSNTYTSSFYCYNSNDDNNNNSNENHEHPNLWHTKADNSNGLKIDIPAYYFKNYDNLEYNIDNIYKVINDEERYQIFDNIKLNYNKNNEFLLYNMIYYGLNDDLSIHIITCTGNTTKQKMTYLLKEISNTLIKLYDYTEINECNTMLNIIYNILEQIVFLFKKTTMLNQNDNELICIKPIQTKKSIWNKGINELSIQDIDGGVPDIFANIEKEIEYNKLRATIGINVKGIREVADYLNHLGFNNIKKSELN